MRRTEGETHAIDRILRARGLPSLSHPDVLSHFGSMVVDHKHLAELLAICEPDDRREMYEAMRPHLRFAAWPLDRYVTVSKERAEARQLPTITPDGNLK